MPPLRPVLSDAPGSASRDAYAAFRFPAYRLFVAGRGLFLVGSQMQTAAVGWQIYERFGTKMALACVGLAQVVPVLLLALPAGHLSDRLERKKLILAGQCLFFCCSLGLGLLSVFHGPASWIYLFLFLLATARVFTMPSMGALLPSVIPREAWGNAAAWNSSLFELTGMIGPALGGFVIAASGGATYVYFTAAAAAVACFVLFYRLRPAQVVTERKGGWTLQDVLGGLRFMFRTPVLLAAASLDLFAVLLGGATALLPVVAKDILHVGPQGFGWLRAAPSVGAVAMALCTAHLPPWRKAGRVLFGAFIGFGLAMIVFGLSRNFWLSMAMLALTGVFDNLNVVIRQTLVQYITPDEMRGRVTAVNFLFIGCSNELGAVESGLAAELLGTVPAIVLGGVGTIAVVAAVMRLAPGLRGLGKLTDVKPAA